MTGNPLSQFPSPLLLRTNITPPRLAAIEDPKWRGEGGIRSRQEELVEAEVKSFIVIPSRGVIQQLKCLLSVPLKVSNNKSQG